MHLVVLFVLDAQALENLDGILRVGRVHENRLEAAFQGRILLDVLAVFVNGCRANALEFTTCKGRLKDIARIEAAFGTTRPHDGVEFVDKENHGIAHALEFHDEALHAFLELAAVLGTGNHGRHVERHDALVHEQVGNLLLHDLLRKAFDDGRLAHAGFTDEGRVVLLAAAEDLDKAFDFGFAPDNRVELACTRHRGEVATEVVENRGLGLGAAAHLALALRRPLGIIGNVLRSIAFVAMLELVEHLLEVFVRDIVRGENAHRRGIHLLQDGKHQVFRADVLVALFLRNLCGIEKHGLRTHGKLQQAIARVAADGHEPAVRRKRALDIFAQVHEVYLERLEGLDGKAGILAHEPEQQVFGRNAVASEIASRHAGRLEHGLRLRRENTVIVSHTRPPIRYPESSRCALPRGV